MNCLLRCQNSRSVFEKLTILYTQVKSWIILWSGLHEQCKCKSKHMHKRTLFYLKTTTEMMTGFMFCVLALGLALHLHRTLFKCKCMNEGKLKYVFLPSWDAGCSINYCLCISLYACLCTRLCMNSLCLHFCLCGSCYLVLYILRVFMMQQFEKLLQH